MLLAKVKKNKETVRFLSVIISIIFLYYHIVVCDSLILSMINKVHLGHPVSKTFQSMLQNCKQGPSPKEALTTRLHGHCYLACPGSDKEVPRIQAMSVLCEEGNRELLIEGLLHVVLLHSPFVIKNPA